ncbi:MAG: hypothetical protein RLP02_24590 [Coleofasciculus sp. C2-GNP5-27]
MGIVYECSHLSYRSWRKESDRTNRWSCQGYCLAPNTIDENGKQERSHDSIDQKRTGDRMVRHWR